MKTKESQLLEEAYKQVNENEEVGHLVNQLDDLMSSGYELESEEDFRWLDKQLGKLVRKHLSNPALLAKAFDSYARITGGAKTFEDSGEAGAKEYGLVKKHFKGV